MIAKISRRNEQTNSLLQMGDLTEQMTDQRAITEQAILEQDRDTLERHYWSIYRLRCPIRLINEKEKILRKRQAGLFRGRPPKDPNRLKPNIRAERWADENIYRDDNGVEQEEVTLHTIDFTGARFHRRTSVFQRGWIVANRDYFPSLRVHDQGQWRDPTPAELPVYLSFIEQTRKDQLASLSSSDVYGLVIDRRLVIVDRINFVEGSKKQQPRGKICRSFALYRLAYILTNQQVRPMSNHEAEIDDWQFEELVPGDVDEMKIFISKNLRAAGQASREQLDNIEREGIPRRQGEPDPEKDLTLLYNWALFIVRQGRTVPPLSTILQKHLEKQGRLINI